MAIQRDFSISQYPAVNSPKFTAEMGQHHESRCNVIASAELQKLNVMIEEEPGYWCHYFQHKIGFSICLKNPVVMLKVAQIR